MFQLLKLKIELFDLMFELSIQIIRSGELLEYIRFNV